MRRLFACLLLLVSAPSAAQNPAPVSPPSAPDTNTNTHSDTAATAAPAPRPTETQADRARRARVYAQVGERAIRVGDIEDAILAQTPFQQERYRNDPAKLRELADRLVQLELLGAEARRRELTQAPRVRDLVESNLVQLLMRRAIDDHITPQSVPEQEVRAYYDAHLEEYARPELVRASHVLVATEAEARALLAQCASGDIAAFRQIARDRSLDGETNQSGGDLRYFTRDGRVQGNVGRPVEATLAAASFAIPEVGECSPAPVPVGDRFSVVKLTGRRAAEATPFETAHEGIRRRIWRARRDQELERMVAEIRARVRVSQRTDLVRLVDIAAPDPAELGHRHGDAPTPAPGEPSGPGAHGATGMTEHAPTNPLERPRANGAMNR